MVDVQRDGVSVQEVISLLDMVPHPEGGWYRETFRDPATRDGRSVGTAIYYLLEAEQRSHWHRVDATEVWHHYAGDPLRLQMSEGGAVTDHILGKALFLGQRPQAIVPAGMWQSAHSLGAWSLVGCTVSPGFEFAGFEMAPEGWEPATHDKPERL